jgi:hypothetical protein
MAYLDAKETFLAVGLTIVAHVSLFAFVLNL